MGTETKRQIEGETSQCDVYRDRQVYRDADIKRRR